jgi:hypothetical protein
LDETDSILLKKDKEGLSLLQRSTVNKDPMIRTLLTFLALLSVAALAFLAGIKFAVDATDPDQTNATRSLILLLVALGGFLVCYLKLAETQDDNAELLQVAAKPASNVELVAEISQVRQEILRLGSSQNLLPHTPSQPGDMNGAVAALAKDLGIREKETQRLQDIISRRDLRNALARLATIRETAEFTRRINAEGKLNDKEALNQLIMEIEAAIADLGMEILHIPVGSPIANLPIGSFSILTVLPAESPAMAGTVKESLSDAVYIKDDSGKALFIAPAKLRVYKL